MKTLLMLSRLTEESEVLRTLLIVFPFLLPINVVDSALVEFPNNTAVTRATNRTEFRCKTDRGDELKWFIQPNDTAQRLQLSSGPNIISEQAKSYCDIQNEEPGNFTLILNFRNESAQTYTCQELDTNQEKSAELIIIEPLIFEKDVSESHVTLTCSVNFRGNWAPELELRYNGISVVDGVEVFVVPNKKVSTTLIVPRNNSTYAGNYRCTTRFNLRGKPKQTTDKSVPIYMDTLIITVYNVEEIHPDTHSDGNSKVVGVGVGIVVAVGVAGIIVAKK